MHILLLAYGRSVLSQRFLQMLLDSGQRITFLDQDNPRNDDPPNYKFIRFPRPVMAERWIKLVWGGSRLIEYLQTHRLRKIWKNEKPDLVNVHFVDDRAWYCVKADLKPLVLKCMGSDINHMFAIDYQPTRYMRNISKALSHADVVTIVSQDQADRCEFLAGQKLSTHIYRYGVNLESFNPTHMQQGQNLRVKENIPIDAKVIVSPRRLWPKLGHEFVLESFSELIRSGGMDNVYLVFNRYLSENKYMKNLEAMAKKLSIDEKVRWLDELAYKDMPILYSIADVVVNYPEADGFSNSFLEALISKKRVICSDLASYKELFGDVVFMVKPCNLNALTAAMRSCLQETKEESACYTELAYKKACEIGNEKINIQEMLKLFEVLAKKPSL